MLTAFLALVLAVPPPVPEPPPVPPVRPSPPVITPNRMPTASVTRVPAGDHVHRCNYCGTEWSHRTGTPGHNCPSCGRQQLDIARWGPTTINKVERVRVSPPAAPAVPYRGWSGPTPALPQSMRGWAAPNPQAAFCPT